VGVIIPQYAAPRLLTDFQRREPDLPPASHTKVMAVSPQILENCGYEDHTIYR
jgi:hypothetical protein